MADEELDLDLDAEQEETPKVHPIDKRINKALSEKAKAEEERAKAEKAAEKAAKEAEAAKKDLEFFKNFNTISSKYQGSAEYQEQIREKVAAGYDIEDAAVAVLNKEGKFVPQTPPPAPKESPAGGSAVTNISKGEKSLGEMTQEEKREILKDNLSLTL